MHGFELLHTLPPAPQTDDEIIKWLNNCVDGKTSFTVFVTKVDNEIAHNFVTKALSISSKTAAAFICRMLKNRGFINAEYRPANDPGYFRITLTRGEVLSVIQATEAREVDTLSQRPPAPPENSLSAYFDTNQGVVEVQEGLFARVSRPITRDEAKRLAEQLQSVGATIAGIQPILQSEAVRLLIAVQPPTPAAAKPTTPARPSRGQAGGIDVRNGHIYIL